VKLAAAAYPLDWFDRFEDWEAKLTRWVEDAARQEAGLLVFPEYAALELSSLGGAAMAADYEGALRETARHSEAVTKVHDHLARKHRVTILGASAPWFPLDGGRPVNRATLYGPEGVIGHQDKQIMTRFEREDWDVAPGKDGLQVFDTPVGKVGIIICYDSEFPLLARRLVERGADILLAPSATETLAVFYRVRIGSQARALENQCVVVHAPIVGECAFCPAVGDNSGSAAIYGPPDLGFPDNGILAETALNVPGWAVAEVDHASIARVRAEGSVLNHAHWSEQAVRLME